MKILMTKRMLCPCCMEEHDVQRIATVESNVFKGIPIEYNAEYYYCDQADEAYADEQQISINDIAMKNAYREKMGLLTSHQIAAIRTKYGISQSDLCLLLGWGGKTITRYESHQVRNWIPIRSGFFSFFKQEKNAFLRRHLQNISRQELPFLRRNMIYI